MTRPDQTGHQIGADMAGATDNHYTHTSNLLPGPNPGLAPPSHASADPRDGNVTDPRPIAAKGAVWRLPRLLASLGLETVDWN